MKKVEEKDVKCADGKASERHGKKDFRSRTSKGRNSFGKDTTSSKDALNDAAWYLKNPQMAADAGRLPFSNFQGVPLIGLGIGSNGNPNYQTHLNTLNVIRYMPVPGVASEATDPVNIAIRNIYTFVRQRNSGAKNYEPVDMGVYLLAVTELYGAIAHLERMYGLSYRFSVSNRAIPKSLTYALCVDGASLIGQQAAFRYGINRLIAKVNSLCVPLGMTLVQRRVWLNSFVFKDSDSFKAQLYMFAPSGMWKYEASKLSSGSCLEYVDIPNLNDSTVWTFNQWLLHVESMIDNVLSDPSMNIISGDILKAFGDKGLLQMKPIDESFIVTPVYQEEMLPQIHNLMTITDADYADDAQPYFKRIATTRDVSVTGYTERAYIERGSDGVVKFKPYVVNETPAWIAPGVGALETTPYNSDSYTSIAYVGTQLLDVPFDNPTADQVMVATRLKFNLEWSCPTIGGQTYSFVRVRSCGSEIVEAIQVLNESNTVHMTGTIGDNFYSYASGIMTQFDWYPLVYGVNKNNVTSTNGHAQESAGVYDLYGDLYNFTILSPDTVAKLHEVALISEFSLDLGFDK